MSVNIEIKNATIIQIGEQTTVGAKEVPKIEFLVKENEGTYPGTFKVEAINERVDILEQFAIGDVVDVFINLNGREWTDKNGEKTAFNSLAMWKMVRHGSEQRQSASHSNNQQPVGEIANDSDDLPF